MCIRSVGSIILVCCTFLSTMALQTSFDCAVQLSIESHSGDTSGTSIKTLSCGMTHDIPDINIVEISILVSDSCGDIDSYTQLAHMDIWSQQPVVDSAALTTNASGSIDRDDDAMSYLLVSQNVSADSTFDDKTYSCVIQGFNSESQPVTASDSIKGRATQSAAYQSNISGPLIESMTVEVEGIGRKLDTLTGQLENSDISGKVQNQSEAILIVGDKLEEISEDVDSKLKAIHQIVDDYKNNDNLHCDKDEVAGILEGLNSNVSSQLDTAFKTIESERIEDRLQCENKTDYIIEILKNQQAASEVTSELNRLDNKVDILDNKMTALDTRMKGLDTAINSLKLYFETLSDKMDVLQRLDDKLKTLSPALLLDFKSSRFYGSGPSDVFKGKLYIFTKNVDEFDINDANTVCQEYGGYLIEIDDEEEFEFINKIVVSLSMDFFTGYDGRNSLGKHIHVDSGRELTINKWAVNSTSKDCVEFLRDGSGLSNKDCQANSRFICEVPYPY